MSRTKFVGWLSILMLASAGGCSAATGGETDSTAKSRTGNFRNVEPGKAMLMAVLLPGGDKVGYAEQLVPVDAMLPPLAQETLESSEAGSDTSDPNHADVQNSPAPRKAKACWKKITKSSHSGVGFPAIETFNETWHKPGLPKVSSEGNCEIKQRGDGIKLAFQNVAYDTEYLILVEPRREGDGQRYWLFADRQSARVGGPRKIDLGQTVVVPNDVSAANLEITLLPGFTLAHITSSVYEPTEQQTVVKVDHKQPVYILGPRSLAEAPDSAE